MNFGFNIVNQIPPSPMNSGAIPSALDNGSDWIESPSFAMLLNEQMAAEKGSSQSLDPMKRSDDGLNPILKSEGRESLGPNRIPTAPLLEFLQKIENEAQVAPQAWAEAMFKVKPEDMSKSPWETVELVVDELKLPKEKKELVTQLYRDLLHEIDNKNSLKEPLPNTKDPLPAVDDKLAPEFMMGLMPIWTLSSQTPQVKAMEGQPVGQPPIAKGIENSKRTAELVAHPRSLGPQDSIQSKLDWGAFEVPKQLSSNIQLKEKMNFEDIKAKLDPDKGLKTNMGSTEPSYGELLIHNKSKSLGAQSFEGAEPLDMEFLSETKKLAEDKALSSNLSDYIGEPQVQNSKKLEFSNFQMASDSQHREILSEKSKSKEMKFQPTVSESSKFFIDSMPTQSQRQELPTLGVPSLGLTNEISLAPKDVNTSEVIRQAQFLVRNGGGEVKIKLYPENLGEINMKMVVEDGKVDLALDASSIEAKKVIEGSLDELRATLTANKLSLESVTVDVGKKSDNQFTQHRNDSSNEFAREQARQFLNNFREDNQSRRWEMAQDPFQMRARPVQEIKAKPMDRISQSRGIYSSGRLNLVA